MGLHDASHRMTAHAAADRLATTSALVGFDVADGDLVETALRPSRQGFSRLEFVGDAVLGLAVATTLHRRGEPPARLPDLVNNDRPDEIYRGSDLARLAPRCSGDVIEALIGAIHLSAGFDAGATAALALVAPENEWEPPVADGRPGGELVIGGDGGPLVPPNGVRALAFVGATLLSCAAADHAVATLPGMPHRALAQHRVQLISPRRVLGLASVRSVVPGAADAGEEHGYDLVQARAAAVFLAYGWAATKPWVADLLAFSSVPAARVPPRRRRTAGGARPARRGGRGQ